MRRKKKGFGYYLYAILALGLFLANSIMLLLLLFHVQKIEVTGNETVEESQIVSWVKEDEYTVNSLYTVWKFNNYSGKIPEYLDELEVRMILPWKLRIVVQEKKPIAAILEEGVYVTFDKEGLILSRTSDIPEGLFVIEGIASGDAKVYEELSVEDKNAFAYIEELTGELEHQKLVPDRLLWETDGMSAYYENVHVKFGKSGFRDKVLQLSAILVELEGKEGTLHLEHYNETNQSITFEKKS